MRTCSLAEVTDAPWPATIAGTLFAVAPFRFLHLGHLSIAAAWAVPLFFWALLRHLRQPSWGRALLVAATGVAVGASSVYHAAYVAPLVPLVLLFGLRRGPGGRAVWIPLVVAGASGLALLAWLLAPYASALRAFGVAAAPGDLRRYGADISSLGQKPDFLGGTGLAAGIDPEAHLYPGAALGLLAASGALAALASVRGLGPWWRRGAWTLAVLAAVSVLGLLVPLPHGLETAWRLSLLAVIWAGPVAIAIWAIASTDETDARGPHVAIRLGVAGAAVAFALALGPEARYLSERIGPAPYWLLAQASSSFEGTRVPARFGGLVILFLSLIAAGVLAELARGGRQRRFAAVAAGSLALVACFAELPLPALPAGRELVPLPQLRDPAYEWVGAQPGRFGILELPDWPSDAAIGWEYRGWRALRYMLASKQHGQHLVNGTGRIEPFLWFRFRANEAWSDGFFGFIASYFPVRYVLVHGDGIPVPARAAVWARLDQGTDGWREVFRSKDTRVYTIDRSSARGTLVDRVFARPELTPGADVAFSARLASPDPAAGSATTSGTLELARDGEVVGAWPIETEWRAGAVSIPIAARAPADYDTRCRPGQAPCLGWPKGGTLLRWRVRGDPKAVLELRSLTVARREITR